MYVFETSDGWLVACCGDAWHRIHRLVSVGLLCPFTLWLHPFPLRRENSVTIMGLRYDAAFAVLVLMS